MKPLISLVAVVDENNGLGKNNKLLCHLPADLQHFKKITMGKPIIMGRKTYESMGRLLPGRANIIVSTKLNHLEGAIIAPNLSKALGSAGAVPEVMIIGGGKIFSEAITRADNIYLTLIHHSFEADVFFPKIDENLWEKEKIGSYKKDDKNLYDLTFYKFKRV
jgi:dihydrofolate reductase